MQGGFGDECRPVGDVGSCPESNLNGPFEPGR